MGFDQLKRRAFITFLGSAAIFALPPLSARNLSPRGRSGSSCHTLQAAAPTLSAVCSALWSLKERGSSANFISARRLGSVDRQNPQVGRLYLDKLAEARGSFPLSGSSRRR
jgi:hypothetical protein